MTTSQKKLLAVVEFLSHTGLKSIYERLGYQVSSEFSVRKAISQIRKNKPDVVVADFFFQPDFRDRVSNIESLLAALQGGAQVKVLVYYDSAHEHALDKVRQRFRIDAALPLPVTEADLEMVLGPWARM